MHSASLRDAQRSVLDQRLARAACLRRRGEITEHDVLARESELQPRAADLVRFQVEVPVRALYVSLNSVRG